jgi:asparagine synthase (glutamine-hydrolysing)
MHGTFRRRAGNVDPFLRQASAGDGLAIVFDGRLDNRDDLMAALSGRQMPLRETSDAALVLAAYRQWGEECPARLLGDFAFAIWDLKRRTVFCARDPLGVKPFFYALDDDVFAWGSDLTQVFASGCVMPEPNEGFIAECLAFAIHSHEETLYRGVMRLPPAHSITVSETASRIARYWRLDPTIELRLGSDDEYAEQFFVRFKDAVACRLPKNGPVAAYLSGGLDSSSVVAMARSLGRDVETFSLVFPDNPNADERPYIDDVVERWGLTGHQIEARPVQRSVCDAHVARRFDMPDLPSDIVGHDLSALLQQKHCRVILTGIGGDYGFGGSPYHYADLLGAADFRGLGRQLAADSQRFGIRSSLWELAKFGVRPVLPSSIRDAARPLARLLGWVPDIPDWLSGDLATRVNLADRLHAPLPADRCLPSRRQVWESFSSGWTSIILERNARSAAEYGIEERHPFLDRRLVEFSLAIPESQRWRGEHTKYVLRRAMRALLPDSVHARRGKADFSACVPQAVDAIGGAALLDHLHIASAGWVKQDRISRMYRESQQRLRAGDEAFCLLSLRLWMVAGIELWYRTVFLKESQYGRFEVAEAVAG